MQPLLKVSDLSVSFHSGENEFQAVRDVSFEVRKGKRWGLLESREAAKA